MLLEFETKTLSEADQRFLELRRRRGELEQIIDLHNLSTYSGEWNKLAADFTAIGCSNNALHCWNRWINYRQADPDT